MKKVIALFVLLSVLLSFATVRVNADNAYNWFAVKKGDVLSLPDNAKFVDEHGGFYLDKTATDRGDKVLYLTFDAGYENGNVSLILDILKEKNTPAAFFILSNLIIKNTELVKRFEDEGHTVCNHTKNHKDLTTLSDEETINNLRALEAIYEEKTGREMSHFFRFPEGRYSEEKLLLLEKNGYTPVFWSVSHADWDNNKQPSPKQAMKKITSRLHNGAIILLHPTSQTNVKILPELIDKCIAEGYRFGRLDELLK